MHRLANFLLTLGLLAGSPGISSPAGYGNTNGDVRGPRRGEQERFLYVATIAQSSSDPDFITVIGAEPPPTRLRPGKPPAGCGEMKAARPQTVEL